MTILVTGSSGFIGKKLLEKIPTKNTLVLGHDRPMIFPKERFFKLDIGSNTDYSLVFDGVETVIHLAARTHVMNDIIDNPLEEYREVNTYGTENLARQAASAGVKRFVFISSIKVNGEATILDRAFFSSDKKLPKDFYGQSKSEAEQILLDIAQNSNLEVVIIRPTLVYGPGVKANFASLMDLVSKGLPLPFGCITNNKRSLVSVNNLVDLIITCIDHPKAVNQVFLVSDDHDVSTSEMVREMAKSFNKSQWQLPIPKWCYRLVGSVFGKQDVIDRLLGSLQVDITHTKETLDWKPPQTLEEGFKETAEAFLLNKENKK
ncbi:UDP-glucose 4-epimerase family protein [Aliivibrio sifiae]|uniref:UDP-glucose 4-epimerase family protein n=1 Tax=Aliivibrio sifiae TaxID=566293 RepID=UPI003D0EE062